MNLNAKTPKEIPSLFVAAWNKRKAEDIAALFTEDADFVNVVGIWWNNKEDIREAHDYGLKHIFQNSNLKLGKVTVRLLNETVAVVHARMRLDDQTRIGEVDKPERRYNIFTFVVQKNLENWLCVSAHNTDIIPGAETNIVFEGKIKAVSYKNE